MAIPPGILYLSRILPVALFPSAVAYVIFRRLALFQTPWISVLAAFAVQPILFGLSILYTSAAERIDAKKRDAVAIPQIPDRWPGGLTNVAFIGKRLRTGFPGDFFAEWFERYGNTILVRLLFSNQIGTTEPAYIKVMLTTDPENFWKGPVDCEWGYSLLGTGIFNTDDEMWKFHRSMTRPFFTRERILEFAIFEKYANDAIDQAATRLRQGYAVDFQDVASRFTLDSSTEFLFGKSADSLSAGLAYPESSSEKNPASFLNHPSNGFVHAFVEAQRLHVSRSRFGAKWRLNEFWRDEVKVHREVIDQFIEPIVNDALAEKARLSTQDSKPETETLLGHLLTVTEDKDIIRDEVLNMLVAGRDTTAATLTYAVYMLAEHPTMADRLRNEILDKVGTSKVPTHDDIKAMPYLRAFINETLRLYPPVPLDTRTSKNATTWPATIPGGRPFYVPAKTKVIYSVFLMHRRTDLWGPDALKFDPDRFMDDRLHKYLTPNPFIFLPFNAGPRICLGQQFAYQEASFFLVRLLQRFKTFALAPDAQPDYSKAPPSWQSSKLKSREKVKFGTSLTIYAKGGLWVRMQEA
ncbi:cytochrome P450 monooxygenase pc-2 [Mycena olivaceomarginata]|nr:cytochrome P450 monooxygenase pc-2 [Mycena olivaceomarginata]